MSTGSWRTIRGGGENISVKGQRRQQRDRDAHKRDQHRLKLQTRRLRLAAGHYRPGTPTIHNMSQIINTVQLLRDANTVPLDVVFIFSVNTGSSSVYRTTHSRTSSACWAKSQTKTLHLRLPGLIGGNSFRLAVCREPPCGRWPVISNHPSTVIPCTFHSHSKGLAPCHKMSSHADNAASVETES